MLHAEQEARPARSGREGRRLSPDSLLGEIWGLQRQTRTREQRRSHWADKSYDRCDGAFTDFKRSRLSMAAAYRFAVFLRGSSPSTEARRDEELLEDRQGNV